MAFGSSNRTKLVYVKESAWGTTPSTPALQELRYTGGDMSPDIKTTKSNEIRSDRMTSDLINTSEEAGGSANFEFSTLTFDDIIEGALYSDWATDVIKNGTTLKSLTFQRQFLDTTSPQYENYVGSRLGGLTIDVKAGAVVTGSFDFQSKSGDLTTSQFASATSVDATSVPVLSAVSDVANIIIAGSASTMAFTSISLKLDNALRRQAKIGSLASAGIVPGRFGAMATVEAYFEDGSIFTDFKNRTAISFGFDLSDTLGNTRTILLPKTKVSAHKIVAGSLDQDCIVQFSLESIYDSATGAMIEITRVNA